MRGALIFVLMLSAVGGAGQRRTESRVARAKANSVPVAASAQGDPGQLVFQQNCGRCHTSPEGFSPRISQTVAMHMRVRANLSEAQYKALLHFLNP